MFMCVSVTDRDTFTFEDVGLIFGVFLSVFFGFLMLLDQPFWLACIWLFLSCSLYLWVCIQIYRDQRKLAISVREAEKSDDAVGLDLDHNRRRLKLCIAFLYVVSLHLVVYLIAMTKIIDRDVTLCGLLLSDVASKLMVTVAATEEHTAITNPMALELIRERSANEGRREFLRYIFHEVRVPLNTVTMGIDILRNTEDMNEERDAVHMMSEASFFMSETLNSVLTMQKMEQGKLELHMEPFRITERLNTMIQTFSGILRANNISIGLDVRVDTDLIVIGDRFQLDHVTANFLSNAIKFSKPHSTVAVVIEYNENFRSRNGRRWISVRVRDEGPGISKEDVAKLFTPFTQIRPGELQQGRGTGIGLSICKQIVKLHGGEIDCESEVGVGSVFSYTIPFEVASNESPCSDREGNARSDTRSDRCAEVVTEPAPVEACLGEGSKINIFVNPPQDFSDIGDVLVVDGTCVMFSFSVCMISYPSPPRFTAPLHLAMYRCNVK